MSFRFAFAFTLGSLSCSGSVQAHEMGPQLDLAAAHDSFVVQVQSLPLSHFPEELAASGSQLRPDPQARWTAR